MLAGMAASGGGGQAAGQAGRPSELLRPGSVVCTSSPATGTSKYAGAVAPGRYMMDPASMLERVDERSWSCDPRRHYTGAYSR